MGNDNKSRDAIMRETSTKRREEGAMKREESAEMREESKGEQNRAPHVECNLRKIATEALFSPSTSPFPSRLGPCHPPMPFSQDIRALRELNHPYILKIYDVLEENKKCLAFVAERVSFSLANALHRYQNLPAREQPLPKELVEFR